MIIPYSRVIGRNEKRTVIGIAVDVCVDHVLIEDDDTNELWAFGLYEVEPYLGEVTPYRRDNGRLKDFSKVIGKNEKHTIIGFAAVVEEDRISIEEEKSDNIYDFLPSEVQPYEGEFIPGKKPKGKKKKK